MRAKPPAAIIFTLHYDGSTFWLPFCTCSLFFVRGPDEGAAMDAERKVPRPANDISRLAREFRGLQQLGHCDIIVLLCP
jgi:hypothetical protein